MKNSTFMDRLSDSLGKVAVKVNSYSYIIAIKNAFTMLTPVIITGAFGTLFSAMVFNSTQGLAKIPALAWLEQFSPISSAISYVTLSFLTIYAVFLIGIELAKLRGDDTVFAGIVAIMSYLAVVPTFLLYNHNDEVLTITNVLKKDYTDTKGLFLGIIVAILSIEIYTRLKKSDKLKIKMPDTVPSNVATSFSALFPTVLTVGALTLLGWLIHTFTGMYIFDIIYNLVQKPLEAVAQGLPGLMIMMLVAQLFWVIGIHGNQMIKPVREPLLLAAIATNTEAFIDGVASKDLPNIITMPFWDMYMSMGGSGVTIGLVIAIFLIGKQGSMREMAKLSAAPGLFNINEPLIFGTPIVLNPILAIPFVITPLITGAIGYFFTYIGFAGRAAVMVPWPFPPLINGYVATAGDWGAVATQLICIIAATLIYLPFVSISMKQEEAGITS